MNNIIINKLSEGFNKLSFNSSSTSVSPNNNQTETYTLSSLLINKRNSFHQSAQKYVSP